ELRAMTSNPEIFDRSVMRSSVRPSAKYVWSESPPRLPSGKTAIDGLSGGGSALRSIAKGSIRDSHGRDSHGRHHAIAPAPTRSATAPAVTVRRQDPVSDVRPPKVLPAAPASMRTRYTRTGLSMFLTRRSPKDSYPTSSF